MNIQERVCDCCNIKTKTKLSDFYKISWTAFQIPAGNGKVYCFCPNCEDCMRKKMIEHLKGEQTT
ncbi:MAG TPA: hypothetical protein VI911_07485 [Patescibacteria group bacterium]|nr:hypothetical protein [Patescibacteria group bacterium]